MKPGVIVTVNIGVPVLEPVPVPACLGYECVDSVALWMRDCTTRLGILSKCVAVMEMAMVLLDPGAVEARVKRRGKVKSWELRVAAGAVNDPYDLPLHQ